eukprot:2425244-Prymnesium_polylepis.1
MFAWLTLGVLDVCDALERESGMRAPGHEGRWGGFWGALLTCARPTIRTTMRAHPYEISATTPRTPHLHAHVHVHVHVHVLHTHAERNIPHIQHTSRLQHALTVSRTRRASPARAEPFGYDPDDLNLELFCAIVKTQCFGAHLRISRVKRGVCEGARWRDGVVDFADDPEDWDFGQAQDQAGPHDGEERDERDPPRLGAGGHRAGM